MGSRLSNLFISSIAVFLIATSLPTSAKETIWLESPAGDKDPRKNYAMTLLAEALGRTEVEYGEFEFKYLDKMSRIRALRSLSAGNIHIYEAPTQPEWEEQLLTVHVPIKKGLVGYRLLLVNENQLRQFANLSSLQQLKQLRAGSGFQWSITKVLNQQGFNLTEGTSYEGLFGMLAAHRFDYFPRGVNEIFNEHEAFKAKHPQMRIEPTKAFYLPLPSYYFVSPQKPKLAERLEKGLKSMIDDGSFDQLFYRFHGEDIARAKLWERQIFTVDNDRIPPHPVYQQAQYWLDPSQRLDETGLNN